MIGVLIAVVCNITIESHSNTSTERVYSHLMSRDDLKGLVVHNIVHDYVPVLKMSMQILGNSPKKTNKTSLSPELMDTLGLS